MAVFKEFSGEDVKTSRSFLNQLVDIINTDISSSSTRRKFQVFVTGGVGPGVTSSLFQSVYDQDFTLQTANAVFDMTIGLHTGSEVVINANPTIDSNGKYLFGSDTLMMREKMDLYRQMAQSLLGDSEATFTARSGSNSFQIKEPLFINFKRLFARDQMKRETFAIQYFPSASSISTDVTGNLAKAPKSTTKILTDINSSVNKEFTFGGQISSVVDSANVSNPLGILFLDKGIFVMDMSRSFDQAGPLSGTLQAVTTTGFTNFTGSFASLLVSGCIDDIVDHLATTRFLSSTIDQTAVTFQNITNINSTLYFARLAADEFNYSSNPTYTDSSTRIVVIDEGQEDTQQSFTFITSVGLYDSNDNLLAVAKLSRPILKDSDRDLTLKIRLDY
jgi:hypothetical protein